MPRQLDARASRVLWLSIPTVLALFWGGIFYSSGTRTDPCPVHGPVRAERAPGAADVPSGCGVFCRVEGDLKAHFVISCLVAAFCIVGCVLGWRWSGKQDRTDR
jgi:hypothetical protein